MKKRILWAILLILSIPVVAFSAGFTSDVPAINEAAKSVLMLEVYQDDTLISTGSGFVAGNNRMLVTNCHVIEGGDMIVGLSDEGYSYLLNKVLAADEAQDIAILGFMSPTDLNPLTFNTGEILRAEPVVAIGSPQGMLNTISMGNVSGLFADGMIQFTAPISNGSSGGALFNDRGEVIGVTTSAIAPDGNVVQNLNFAVNASSVLDLLNTVNEKDYVSLGDYSNGMLPGSTPEPTVTPEPTTKPTATPVPELGIRNVTMLYNGDGTATFSWYDDINREESTYHIAIDNARLTGDIRYQQIKAMPDSNGYTEASVKFKVFCGETIKYAVSRNHQDVKHSVVYGITSPNIGTYTYEPTTEILANYEELDIGSKGENVKALQEWLIRYSYLNGSADGVYGKQTAAAVKAFNMQNISGAPDTATPEMQAYLFKGNPKVVRYCVGIAKTFKGILEKNFWGDTKYDYGFQIQNKSGKNIKTVLYIESCYHKSYEDLKRISFSSFRSGETIQENAFYSVGSDLKIRLSKIEFSDGSVYYPLEDNWYTIP